MALSRSSHGRACLPEVAASVPIRADALALHPRDFLRRPLEMLPRLVDERLRSQLRGSNSLGSSRRARRSGHGSDWQAYRRKATVDDEDQFPITTATTCPKRQSIAFGARR